MSEFENHTRATLDESVANLDGRVRSRLTQARHAAIEELSARRKGGWMQRLQLRTLAPAGAVAAAAVVAVILLSGRGPVGSVAPTDSATIEDMELLADNDALEVSSDGDYEFYEWAAAQEENGAPARGT